MGDDLIYQRSAGASYEWSGDRIVILDVDGAALTTLNPTGSLIWEAMGEGQTVGLLAAALTEQVAGVDRSQAVSDVEVFLAELAQHRLVEVRDPA